ncbi:HWE histidine kinase domain-containing protein [Rhizobium sp. OAE497]|uniref:HWE histidine kinase domain-containing protein n=1 Tax=unclassified Rhizobium TaxID=2613769 RepID=UPI000DD631B0
MSSETSRTTPLAILTYSVARLAGVRDPKDIVQIVRSTARSMIGCQGIAVIRKEGDLCHYIDEDAIGSLWKGQKFPASACVSGWAMAERRTLVIPDIAMEPRLPSELYQGTFVRAIAMAPVGVAEPVGAIGAYWAAPYSPTDGEIAVLEALASAAATAIENVRLIEALSKALEDAELARDELRHRVKNAYMGVQGLARLSVKGEAGEQLVSRIAALARTNILLDERITDEARIDLQELVEIELEPYRTTAAGRFVVHGPVTEISGARAVPLGLAINELATNALKHGALSVAEGRVEISWSRDGGHLYLSWTETNGPTVTVKKVGEGSGLLARLVERQLRGTLRHVFEPEGVRCSISFDEQSFSDVMFEQTNTF